METKENFYWKSINFWDTTSLVNVLDSKKLLIWYDGVGVLMMTYKTSEFIAAQM